MFCRGWQEVKLVRKGMTLGLGLEAEVADASVGVDVP